MLLETSLCAVQPTTAHVNSTCCLTLRLLSPKNTRGARGPIEETAVSFCCPSLYWVQQSKWILSDPWCSWTQHDRWLSHQRLTQLRAASEPLAVWMTSSAAAVWLITLITCLPCMWFQSQACPCSSSARCVKTTPSAGRSHSDKQKNNRCRPQLAVKSLTSPCWPGSLVWPPF